MARYIDADAFIDFIRNLPKEPNGFSKSYDESAIVRFVENQTTAYDVEAVVAELEKEKVLNTCDKSVGFNNGIRKAISIVRGKE